MQKKYVALSVILGVGILILLFLVFSRSWGSKILNTEEAVSAITITNGQTQFTLDSSGNAVWKTGDNTRSELWSSDKTSSLFAYFYANWLGSSTINGGIATLSNPSDELANIILGDDGNGDEDDGDVSQYFPSPSAPPGGGSGGGGTGTGDTGAPSWCLHWRLSYCADPPPSSSSPTTTPVPTGPTPLPPDCNNQGNQQTGRTVIGNELCLSPTPVATP